MSQPRGETSNSGPEIERYKYKSYEELRDGWVNVKFSENIFRCPYCRDRRDYTYENLLRHASQIAITSVELKEKARHMGLEEYLERDLHAKLLSEEKSKKSEEIRSWADSHMATVMELTEARIEKFNTDIKMMRGKANEQLKKIALEHEQSILLLEDRERELRDRERKLRAREAINESEKRGLDNEKIMKELLILETKKAHERMLKLAENQKGLKDNPAHARIGVKRMGELELKPFLAATKRQRCSIKGEADNPINLASLWEKHLRNPCWHPFKIITIHGDSKEILDEDDERITSLKEECNEDIYNAVVTALKELNKYNPSCRHPLSVLWNNNDKRKATLKEGVECLLKQWKTHKQWKRVEDDGIPNLG
ncbi:hypothetical protein L6452_03515 [Arctium lappa]|uniref:Uncharacterized protein n=1 Tax=Arctium lappa TaxID=4217 RepID=A0ACB9FN12_ARCLA|nr:hypothetical protein L6452_03515 [Arctium lappa]